MSTLAQAAEVQAGEPVERKPQMPIGGPVSPIAPVASQMSPFFHCSMPVKASTYDSLSRQFYGRPRAPQTRILPAGSL